MTGTPDLKSTFGTATPMQKGQEVVLSESDLGLKKIRIGLGWDVPEQVEGLVVDIDASAFLLNRDGKVRRDTDFVFYNNLETEGYVKHGGDNLTGAGDGDDETIEINLEQVGFDVEKIAFSVTIHNAEERKQAFGIVKNAFIRVVNLDTQEEMARFDLSEDASEYNAIIFGELAREGLGWKFKAIGSGTSGGLYKIARDFGVNVAPN